MHYIPYTNYDYSATVDGNIISHKCGKNKVLKQSFDRHGYKKLNLWVNGSPKYYQVHRAVYSAFHGDIPENMVVDHINHDPTDNRLDNLQLLTPAENLRKARDAGRTLSTIEAARKNGKARAKGFVKQSGMPNVYWNRVAKKWFGARYVDGVRYATKYFDDADKASQALITMLP